MEGDNFSIKLRKKVLKNHLAKYIQYIWEPEGYGCEREGGIKRGRGKPVFSFYVLEPDLIHI